MQNLGLRSARDGYRTFTPDGSCVAFATPPLAADRPLQTRHTPCILDPDGAPTVGGLVSVLSRLYSDQVVAQYKNLLKHDQYQKTASGYMQNAVGVEPRVRFR